METRYAVYLHLDLLENLPKQRAQTEKLFRFIRSLADNPFIDGDFSDSDNSLRRRQIKIIGDFAVTYWADHPGKQIIVVDISLADH
jgi:hypothetical protein